MVYSISTLSESYNDTKSISEIIYETEYNWNSLMDAINIIETSSIETRGEIIYEAVDFKAFFGKVRDFFKNLFDKIKRLFTTIILKIKSKTFRIRLNDPKIKNIKIPKDFEFQGYQEYTNLDYDFNTNYKYYFKNARILPLIEYMDSIKSTKPDPTIAKFISEYGDQSNIEKAMDNIRGDICKSDNPITQKEFKEHCNNFFIKDEPYNISTSNLDISKYLDILNNGDLIKDLEKDFNKIKSEEDSLLFNLNFSKEFARNSMGFAPLRSVYQQKFQALTVYINLIKSFYVNLFTMFDAKLSAAKNHVGQAELIIKQLLVSNKIFYTNDI